MDANPNCELCKGLGWKRFYDPRGPEFTECACGMGWMGDWKYVLDIVQKYCDVDEETKNYVMRGRSSVSFMGAEREYVVNAVTQIRVNGEWEFLVPMLQGGTNIYVI